MSQTKVVFLYNKYEREHWNNELIGNELVRRGCKIYEVGFSESGMLNKVVRIRPRIIITFSIKTDIQRYVYAYIKKVTGCIFVTFTTEGYTNLDDETVVKAVAGYYSYSPELIDYHVYWGEKMAKVVGRELYRQGKLKSKSQIRVFGNPMYEKDKIQLQYAYKKLGELNPKGHKVILVLTGFSATEYNADDIIRAQDLFFVNKSNGQFHNELKQTMEKFERFRVYRDKYIDAILEAVEKNKDVLFVVKLHPIEMQMIKENKTPQYLRRFQAMGERIIIIEEMHPIGVILPYCDLVIHYGSTVNLEAYIYQVPTLLLTYNGILNKWGQATYCEDVEDSNIVDKYVKACKNENICFQKNEDIEKQLENLMNYSVGAEYHPSEDMAEFLCSNLHRNVLHLGICAWVKLLKWRLKQVSFRKMLRKFSNAVRSGEIWERNVS